MNDSANSTGIDQRWEAFAAVALAIGLQVLLAALSDAHGWKVWTLPWWVWLVLIGPEVALLALLAMHPNPRETVVLGLVMFAVNAFALISLIGSIVTSHEHNGGQLLLKGATVWMTNVTAFGIIFWQLAYRRRDRHQF